MLCSCLFNYILILDLTHRKNNCKTRRETFQFSELHLNSRLNTSQKTTARQDEKHLSFGIWCTLYQEIWQQNGNYHTWKDGFILKQSPGGGLNVKIYLTSIMILMLKIRRSCDRLILNMGIPIPGKDGLYIEPGPRSQWVMRDVGNPVYIGCHVFPASLWPAFCHHHGNPSTDRPLPGCDTSAFWMELVQKSLYRLPWVENPLWPIVGSTAVSRDNPFSGDQSHLDNTTEL